MSGEFERLAERLRQSADARRRELREQFANTRSAPQTTATTLRPGARVFDTISGEFGEVIYATRENVIVPASK